jgi:hypothetical protein
VIQGTNVLNLFNQFKNWASNPAPAPTNLVLNGYFASPLNTLPVLNSNFPPTTSSFVFIDITLLQVAIQPVGGGREISWNSAAGMTNIIEFTTNLPPVWNTLVSTNGTGSRMAVVDSAADTKRFYRVRVAN